MTISEGVLLFFAGIVTTAITWGINEFVSTSRRNAAAIAGINMSLATMTGRLNNTEAMLDRHHEEDQEKFRKIDDVHKEMWHAVNHR